MFDQRFLTSKVGFAALVSVAAMVAFNLYALAYQAGASAQAGISIGSEMLLAAPATMAPVLIPMATLA